jgi:TonB-linked SusC/RagA family outer membrane protein
MMLHGSFRCTVLITALAMLPVTMLGQSAQIVRRTDARADDPLSRQARLRIENVTLGVALVRLTESSGVALAFSPSQLPAGALVSCRCELLTVGEALDVLLAGTSLYVRESDGRVMLTPATATRPTPSAGMSLPLARPGGGDAIGPFVLPPTDTALNPRRAVGDQPAQSVASIAGVIVDSAANNPIAGAQVIVETTTRGAITDASGRFRIDDVPAGDLSLRVTMLGYRPVVRRVTAGTMDIRVALERLAVGLEGVVVTASGTQRIREVGSDIARVRADSVAETSPATNLSELLTSRASGVYIKTASGSSVGGTRIRIRGSSSPSLANEPLVYVDGVRINTDPTSLSFANNQQVPSRFNDINPDEIESIDVLKGPSASTMYGTEAANGVILITTKSGSAASRRAEWRVWAEGGQITEPNDYPANYGGVTATGTPCLLSSVAAGTCTQASLRTFNLLMTDSTTPFKTGNRTVGGASLTGKAGDINYFFSAEREDEAGVYERDGIEKTNVRANFGVRPTEKSQVQVSAGYVRSDLGLFADGGTGIGVVTNAMAGGACATCWFQFSPQQLARIDATQHVDRFIGSSTVNVSTVEWLDLRGIVGLDVVSRQDSRLFPVGVFPGARAGGERNVGENTSLRTTADLLARLAFPISATVSSRTSLGVQYLADRTRALTANGTSLVPGTNSLGAAGLIATREGSSDVKTLGAYAEQQVSFQDRLFVTAGVRTDRNSSFGRESKTVVYPKVGASWVLSEESYFPTISSLSSFRVRAAWGQSGSQPGPLNAITYFGSFPVVTPEGTNQVGVTFDGGNLGNPRLKPERSTEIEAGFDATFFGDRLELGVTYYAKRTQDALVLRQIAPSVGASAGRWENLSEVRNTGWEGSVNAVLYRADNVQLGLAASGTYNENELERLGEGVAPITLGTNQRHTRGYPLGGYWMRNVTGFADANGDGILAATEVQVTDTAVYLGEVTPPFMASIQPSLELFRRLRLGAVIGLSYGNELYNFGEGFRCNGGGARGRNDITTPLAEQAKCVAHALRGVPGGFVQNAGFTKLREASATITVPGSWVSRARMRAASITIAGQNLGTWTGYDGVDPDISSRGSNFETVDFLQPGPRRVWVLRANLGF